MHPPAFRVSGPSGSGGRARVKAEPKPFWGGVCKILSRSVQGFGFPLALRIPTDKETYMKQYFLKEVLSLSLM